MKLASFFIFVLSAIIYLTPTALNAQTSMSDAIAIRVMPNPNHFSPIRWYNEQKFHGSPQEMVVDGYDAIRDGNIVYVNAANVANNNFYTNIYAISFNLGADVSTGDIFGQILQYWKFNNNIVSDGACSGLPTIGSDCSGTVGCWLFDNNYKDGSPNNYDGTPVGAVSLETRDSNGQALVLPVSNNYPFPAYVNIGDQPNIALNNEFTITADIYPTGPGSAAAWNQGGIIINKENEYEIARGSDGTISYAISNTNLNNNPVWQWIATDYKAPLNTWTNLVWVYGRNTIRLYANGELVHQKNFNGSNAIINFAPVFKQLFIGAREGYNQLFQGKIDNVKIYNHILNDSCSSNSDCSADNFCQSTKMKLVRDTRRLADLSELNRILAQHRSSNDQSCPIIAQGSYVPNHSVSTWPSWQGALGQSLGQLLPLDPINALGMCRPDSDVDNPNYSPETCWDSLRKIFAKPITKAPPYTMELPPNSYAYSYVADKDGRKCAFNTMLETNYSNLANAACVDGGSQACPNNPITASASAVNPNDTINIDCTNIAAYPGSPISSFINIRPKKNSSIATVSLSNMSSSWNTALPEINRYQGGNFWQLKSPVGGLAPNTPAIYGFRLNVADSAGGTITKDCSIKVLKNDFVILPVNALTVVQGNSLNNVYAKASIKNSSLRPISFKVAIKDGNGNILNTNHAINSGFYESTDIPTDWVPGIPSSQSEFIFKLIAGKVIAYAGPNGSGGNYILELKAKDSVGNEIMSNSIITVINHQPSMDFSECPPANVRFTDSNIPCFIKTSDPDNQLIKAVSIVDAAGLTLASKNNLSLTPEQKVDFSFSPNNNRAYSFNSHSVSFNATDQYGVNSQPYFWNVNINNFCGDNIKDGQNTEKAGGKLNDGKEDCDAPSGLVRATFSNGLALSPSDSNANKQYECSGQCTNRNNCAGTCKYTGGWCGDQIIQANHGEACDNGSANSDTPCTPLYGATCTYCNSMCQLKTVAGSYCGDGTVDSGEECDKGSLNGTAGSGCSKTCLACTDKDGDGYGDVAGHYGTANGCRFNAPDCDDNPAVHPVTGTLGTYLIAGNQINPGEPDDCTQYDGIDNNCDGHIDEHANISTVIGTNVQDMETVDPISGYPYGWSANSQPHSKVTVSTAQNHTPGGSKSIVLHQDPNILYSGSCTKANCTDPDVAANTGCFWDEAGQRCLYPTGDSCHPSTIIGTFNGVGYAASYNVNESICWGHNNTTTWGSLNYNLSTFPFNLNDTYILNFYYKGSRAPSGVSTSLSYDPGWPPQCYTQSSLMTWRCLAFNTPNSAYSAGSPANCSDYDLGGVFNIPLADSCLCLVLKNSAAHQSDCYSAVYPGNINAGNYSNWTFHSSSFVYDSALDSIKDATGARRLIFGLAFGYDDTGPGHDLYIDDLNLLKCYNH